MRIPIIDNIIMTSDPHNFILNREVIGTEGKKALKAFAFYPTVPQALEGCLDVKLGESTARSLKGLLREYHALLRCFRELFKEKIAS